ncbi:MAG: hypothetical protein FJ000_08575, partial [Actinobacteria bacterium]|nr:hypothetical protein [Actinomycetota bacterium]
AHRPESDKTRRGRRHKAAAGDAAPIADAPAHVLREAERESAAELVARVDGLIARRRDLRDQAEAARRELARVAGFGEFDPAVLLDLAGHGVHVRLAKAAPQSAPTAPEGFFVERLGADANGVYVAIVAEAPFEVDELDLGVAVVEVRSPQESPARLRSRADLAAAEAGRIDAELAALSPLSAWLEEHVASLADAERFAAVRSGMGVAQRVAFLQGYVPAEAAPDLRGLAGEHGWGLQLADPQSGDPVPTMLRYSRVVAPIRAVFDFLKIYPSYWEADIGWTFLIFFSIFFAMLAGDAVYGLFLVLATAVLQLKLRRRVPGYIYGIMYITSTLTIIWGMLSGNYVGIGNVPDFLESIQVEWLKDRDHVIELCFFLGAVHLTIAHVWNVFTVRPRSKALAQVGWIMIVWTMLFLARTMVLDYPLPSWILYVFAVGAVLVAVFMATRRELKESFINHALLPLTIISSFVDVLSYVRLFAVGFATVAVISAFNMMASSIGWDSAPRAIGAVLVIVFANVLNLVLIALAVLVHAVRLNTLEFSSHKGISWQGQLFEPFRRSRPARQSEGAQEA